MRSRLRAAGRRVHRVGLGVSTDVAAATIRAARSGVWPDARLSRWLLAATAAATVGSSGLAHAGLRSVPDSAWQTNGRVRAIDYAGGVVYIGGSFTAVRPAGSANEVSRNHAAAFDARTGELLRWNPNANSAVWTLAARDSVVYLGGSFTTVRGRTRAHVAAVGAIRGGLQAWNPGTNGTVHTVLPDSKGRVYLGGAFSSAGGQQRARLARVGTRGGVQSWSPRVTVGQGACPPDCPPIVFALGLSRDESTLYIGGRFGFVNGVARKSAAAVTTTTGSTLPWDPRIVTPNPRKPAQVGRILDIALSSTRAYLCGDFWSADGVVSANLVGVDLVNGNRDAAFNANTDGGSPACEYRSGLVYVGGHFGQVGPKGGWVFVPGHKATLTGSGTTRRLHIAAFDADTGAVAAWNPGANSKLGVHALAKGKGRLGVGGDFTVIGGVSRQGFAQFSVAP